MRLKLFSDRTDSIAAHEKLYVGGAERRLLTIRDAGKTAVVRFEGIADRSAAEALRGSLVEVDRSALPPLEQGEYYHADLLGLPAVDAQGNSVGTGGRNRDVEPFTLQRRGHCEGKVGVVFDDENACHRQLTRAP